ncbi:MAG: hypothetical protein ACOH1I_01155 [Gallionellaceae bacterium]
MQSPHNRTIELLSEAQHGQTLDTRRKSEAIGLNTQLEAVAALHWCVHTRRQGEGITQRLQVHHAQGLVILLLAVA